MNVVPLTPRRSIILSGLAVAGMCLSACSIRLHLAGTQVPEAQVASSVSAPSCETPVWFSYQSRPGIVIGLGYSQTVEGAYRNAVEDIARQRPRRLQSECKDRYAVRRSIESGEELREHSACETRVSLELDYPSINYQAEPLVCQGRAWVKLGLDQRSLVDRLAERLPPGDGTQTRCEGAIPLRKSRLCQDLALRAPGRGSLPVSLSQTDKRLRLTIAGESIDVAPAHLDQIIRWPSADDCSEWADFQTQDSPQSVQEVRDGSHYRLKLGAPSAAFSHFSLLALYEDGRFGLLVGNRELLESTTSSISLQARLEQGQEQARDRALIIRHTEPLDWRALPNRGRLVATSDSHLDLPDLMNVVGELAVKNFCLRSMRIFAG